MREIDQLEDAIDECKPERQQGVHRAEAQPIDDLLQQNRIDDHWALAPRVKSKFCAEPSMTGDCFVAALLAMTAFPKMRAELSLRPKRSNPPRIYNRNDDAPCHELCGATPMNLY